MEKSPIQPNKQEKQLMENKRAIEGFVKDLNIIKKKWNVEQVAVINYGTFSMNPQCLAVPKSEYDNLFKNGKKE